MKILLTGATGYIGKRLLPELMEAGHEVICCVRDANRFSVPDQFAQQVSVVEMDFLEPSSLNNFPTNIDAAFYLIHSMSGASNFESLELKSAKNFRAAVEKTTVQQVIYLSGIVNEDELSRHLSSRKAVEDELSKGSYACTTLRAGIIIGSGSASFEIIRDLVEKLPVMVTPKWLNTRCQPIAIRDVIQFLSSCLLNPATYNEQFDIGGPTVLSYKEMLLGYARVRGLKRYIFIVPVMTPKISSYWLYFITSTSYRLAVALVNSMKIEVVCRDNRINELLGVRPMDYETALERTLQKTEQHQVVSSWKDALISSQFDHRLSDFIDVPTYGCFVDHRSAKTTNSEHTLNKIWQIGGHTGWYHATWLWRIRGFIDRLSGGVGLRRGRTHPSRIQVGDTIDFWRVLYANKEEGRLLLFAEMKLPGEAWLEFKISGQTLHQTATFRPKGVMGRVYWFMVLPFHSIIFQGLINKLSK
jgi:uncharacterized protein YbjT (DUF2867 family)